MKEEVWITIGILLVIGVIIIVGVWYYARNLSETDEQVLGAWEGSMVNVGGEERSVAYLFWVGGNYTILSTTVYGGPLYERGTYTTAPTATENMIQIQFTPNKTTQQGEQFSPLGQERTEQVQMQESGGIRSLLFVDGSKFVEADMGKYNPPQP